MEHNPSNSDAHTPKVGFAADLLVAVYERIAGVVAADPTALSLPTIEEVSEYRVLPSTGPHTKGWGKNNLVFLHPSITDITGLRLQLTGNYNVILIAKPARLTRLNVSASSSNNIMFIGEDVRIRQCTIMSGGKKSITLIGARTQIQGADIYLQEDGQYVRIGDDCLFSSHIEISTGDGHPIYDRYTGDRINLGAPVTICSKVWIGRSARINKGVRIGEGGVIAQCSVVTKNTLPYSVSGGMPAKLIRLNVAWEKKTGTPFVPLPRS